MDEMPHAVVLGPHTLNLTSSRHAQSFPLMFASRVLRRPTNTLHTRLFASKSTSAVPKAAPERTTAAGSPPTDGEQKNVHATGLNAAHSQPPSDAIVLRPEHHPRGTELPQGPTARARSS
jgi:hypothetical protein